MTALHYTDPVQAYFKLAQDLYNSLSDTLTAPQLELIACLNPTCEISSELAKRKWMALVTLTSVLYVRTTIGSENVTDVLTELAYCDC